MVDNTVKARPLSPHLQIWRWHVTLAASILHRVTGIGLYGGLLILAGWALALDKGPEAFATYGAVLGSPPGLIVLILVTLCAFFHLFNGLRHLAWDVGKGFAIKTANATAIFALILAAAAAAIYWLALASGGKLS